MFVYGDSKTTATPITPLILSRDLAPLWSKVCCRVWGSPLSHCMDYKIMASDMIVSHGLLFVVLGNRIKALLAH
jgi:hypothetical protein